MEPTKPATFDSLWKIATEEAKTFNKNPRLEEITRTFVDLVHIEGFDENQMNQFIQEKADKVLNKVWKQVSRDESDKTAIPDLFRKQVQVKYNNQYATHIDRFIHQQETGGKRIRAIENREVDPDRFIDQIPVKERADESGRKEKNKVIKYREAEPDRFIDQ